MVAQLDRDDVVLVVLLEILRERSDGGLEVGANRRREGEDELCPDPFHDRRKLLLWSDRPEHRPSGQMHKRRVAIWLRTPSPSITRGSGPTGMPSCAARSTRCGGALRGGRGRESAR